MSRRPRHATIPVMPRGWRTCRAPDGRRRPAVSRRSARDGDDPDVIRGLDQAQFKARLDAGAHIRPKRWAFRLRPIVVGVLLVVAMLVLGVLIFQALDRQVVPAVAVAQRNQKIQQQLAEGKAALESWKLDEAEAAFRNVQALDPDNIEAADGLEVVAARRKLKALCDEADKLFSDGDLSRGANATAIWQPWRPATVPQPPASPRSMTGSGAMTPGRLPRPPTAPERAATPSPSTSSSSSWM